MSRQLPQKFRDIGSPQRTLRQILVAQGLLSPLNQHVASIFHPAHLAFHDLELSRIEQIVRKIDGEESRLDLLEVRLRVVVG